MTLWNENRREISRKKHLIFLPNQSYYDEMDPESLIIPLRLRGKREIVFGNLLEIKTFHET